MGAGFWAEVDFLGREFDREGLLEGEPMELLWLVFPWLPSGGLDPDWGFSWAALWTAEVLSCGALPGAWGLSAVWAEEDGGSAFSRESGLRQESGPERENKRGGAVNISDFLRAAV